MPKQLKFTKKEQKMLSEFIKEIGTIFLSKMDGVFTHRLLKEPWIFQKKIGK